MEVKLKLKLDHTFYIDFNCEIIEGLFYAINGNSGAGKTTILKAIAGLIKIDLGKISFNNKIWTDTDNKINIPIQKRKIGFVNQDNALFPNLSVLNHLNYANLSKDQHLLNEILNITELENHQHKKPDQLSGGQKQRLAIARALISKPNLLLLDEPFSALDKLIKHQIQQYLIEYQAKYSTTIILVSHQIADIFKLADHIIEVNDGKIISSKMNIPEEIINNEFQFNAEIIKLNKIEDQLHLIIILENKPFKIQLPLKGNEDLAVGNPIQLNQNLTIV